MEWKKVKLGEVCDLIAGFAFKASDFGDYPQKVIKIGDITPPCVSFSTMVGVDMSKYSKEKLAKYQVSYDDFVLAMTGATIGKIGRYINNELVYVNQRVLLFRPHQNVDKKFIYHTLNSPLFQKYIINHIDSDSAQPNISAGTIGKYDISLPPLPTQRRIASILSSLDAQIENNNRINANLEAQAQALFKSWFVDFEPWGGVMPEDWKEGNAEDFFEINIGKTPPRKEKQWFSTSPTDKIWVSISDLGACGTFIGDSSEYLTLEAIKKHNIILVPQNTVLLSFKLTIGRVAIASKELTTNEAIARFILPNMECREFLYLCLKQYDYNCLGSTSSIATAVNSKIIKAMKMIMPTQSVLRDFSKHTAFLFEQILVNQQQSARLAALRDTLLPKLMKGEIEL